jgi:hypothetical protein
MPSLIDRVMAVLSPARRVDRRNVEALAAKLGCSREDAEQVYRRSHEVGFGAAMLEYEQRCRERDATRG